MRTIKTYIVKTYFSSREIQARNKKEAKEIFVSQIKGYYHGEKITVE